MQGLLADYLPDWLPDDPNKKEAMRNGLLNFGAALMGGRGNIGQILGSGLMAGSQGYAGSMAAQQATALQAAQKQHFDLTNQGLQAQLDEPAQIAAAMQGNGPTGASVAPSTPATNLPTLAGGAMPSPVAALPQLGQPSLSDKYTAQGDALMARGMRAAAKEAYDRAEKARPKYSTEFRVALGPDGKPHNYLTAEDGSFKDSGLGVKPDIHILDGGGSQQVLDYNDIKPGTSFAKTVTPGELLQSQDQGKQRAQQERHWQVEQSSSDDAPMDPLAVRMTAQQYLAGDAGALQNFGRGAQGAKNLNAVRLEVSKQATAAGMNGADIAAKMAEFAGMKAGQRTAGIRSASIEIAANEVAQLAPIALEASDKVARSGFLPFGKAQMLFNANNNDPNMRQFAMANTALVNAYGQAMARGGAATVSDKDHARELLSTAFDQKSYAAAVEQLQKETRAAQAAPKQVRKDLSDAVSGRDSEPPKPVKPVKDLPQKAPVAALSFDDAAKERRYQEWKRSQNK